MSKYRVYELAKEFQTTSKVILEVLSRNHKDTAKNHMSSVGDEERDIVKRVFSPEKARQAQPSRPVPQPKAQQPAARPQGGQQSAQQGQNRPSGQQGNRPAGQQGQSPSGQPGNRPGQQGQSRPGGQQGNRPAGQQGQSRPSGQQGNRSGQQGQSRPSGQQGQSRPSGQQGNRPAGQQGQSRPSGQQGNRPAGQQGQNRPGGQQGNRSGQQGQSRPGGQQGNRPGQQGQNRPSGQQGNRPGQQGQNRPSGQQGNRPTGQQGQNRPGGQQGNRPGQQGQSRPGGQNRPGGRPGQQGGGSRFGSLARRSPATRSKAAAKNRRNQAAVQKVVKCDVERPASIKLGDSIIVKDFAAMIGSEVSEVIKKLMMLGTMVTINQEIDFDMASLVAEDFGIEVEALPPEEDPTEIPVIVDDPATLVSRPPVVTVMGHVDHGKTSLLDAIRKTRVQAREAGGITQHIGAYQVVCNDKKIVFLDTPGHEAFTAMRARGAQVTDIAILVVAADDGVMPQTIEAINHAKAAKVPILVAINKIDREGANPDHVKQQLSEYGLIPEDWGGDTIMAPVSAKKQTGIDELLEMVLLVAEMQELKANPDRQAQGIIIEAQLDKGRGPVATVLVQAGTLQVGDSIIAGVAHGKVRAMINDRGEKVKKAGPSTPVEVLGLTDVPEAGDILAVLDEKTVRAIADKRIAKRRSEEIKQKQKVSLDDLFQQIQDGNIKDLNILIKADVQGSVEALRSSLLALNESEKNKEVRVNIIHAGAGAVNESDVMLASAANALILAFNVRPDANARKLAETESIDVRTYRVIYEAIGDVEAAMTGMLAPKYQEVVQGKAEIRQVMNFSKALVAGSYVLEGKVTNASQIRLIRDGAVVYEGVIESLRRFKDDVKEVAAGFECGITIDKYRDFKEGDIIEAFTMEEIKPGAATPE